METMVLNVTSPKDASMEFAVNSLKQGGVGIFPTDTVYGLGCNALDSSAIDRLFNLKNRNYSKPINVLVSNYEMLDLLVQKVSKLEKTLIENFWPGALTIIFDKKESVSNILTANLGTVGVRMPHNPIALELINKVGLPLATTSANLSGNTPGISLLDFYNDFNSKIDFIIDSGNSEIQIPSTIARVENNEIIILREGSITINDIRNVVENNVVIRTK